MLKGLLLSQYPQKEYERLIEAEFKGRIKHNLEMLKRELLVKGVNWPSRQSEQLRRVRTLWSSEMRYESNRYRREDALRVIEAAEGLFRWAAGE